MIQSDLRSNVSFNSIPGERTLLVSSPTAIPAAALYIPPRRRRNKYTGNIAFARAHPHTRLEVYLFWRRSSTRGVQCLWRGQTRKWCVPFIYFSLRRVFFELSENLRFSHFILAGFGSRESPELCPDRSYGQVYSELWCRRQARGVEFFEQTGDRVYGGVFWIGHRWFSSLRVGDVGYFGFGDKLVEYSFSLFEKWWSGKWISLTVYLISCFWKEHQIWNSYFCSSHRHNCKFVFQIHCT